MFGLKYGHLLSIESTWTFVWKEHLLWLWMIYFLKTDHDEEFLWIVGTFFAEKNRSVYI